MIIELLEKLFPLLLFLRKYMSKKIYQKILVAEQEISEQDLLK